MSCFSGILKEYPSISVDCFTKENLESKAFFLSHCHKDHMDGLDSVAFANVLKSSSNLFIYCSDTTRNLVLCNPFYVHLKDYLVGIPIEQPYLVTLQDHITSKKEVLTVTLLSAGHCVGSVMFLFEGTNGNVLYTGDFRLAKGDSQRIKLMHTSGGVKDIKSIYITTFCLPQMMSIPSRKETRDAVIQIIDRWICRGTTHMVSLQCKGMYGYEYLLKEIAQHYKTKIHISQERLNLYQYLTDLTPYFTNDPQATRVHSCKWEKTTKDVRSSLPCGFTLPNGVVPKVIKIKPSSMWFARRPDPLPTDNAIYCKENKTWRVVHSMHASMEEIIDLVAYIRPYHVYANVEPAGQYSLDDACKWLKEYTRVDECNSCNLDDSGQSSFQARAAEFKVSTEHQANKKFRKTCVHQTAPTQAVIASYKELGLEEDTSLTHFPAKRKRKDRIKAINESPTVNTIIEGKPFEQEYCPTGDNSDNEKLTNINTDTCATVSQSTGDSNCLSILCKSPSSVSICDAESLPVSPPNACTTESLSDACASESLTRVGVSCSPPNACTTGSLSNASKTGISASVCTADSPQSVLLTGCLPSPKNKDSPPSAFTMNSQPTVSNEKSPPHTCVFDIPASPGIQPPSIELLSNLYKQLEHGDLKI